MKTLLCSFIILLSMVPCLGQDESKTIVDFYPTADSISEFPPIDIPLSIICQKKINKNWVTFVGRKNEKKIFIAAVTLKRIVDVNREISLTVNFDEAKPTTGKINTWGYVFDRNNDGKIDYMALLGGAAAFEDRNFPHDYPVRDENLDQQQLEVFVGHCKLVFDHWADDNFDGTVDAVIHIDMDPVRDWVQRRMVIRSTKFDNTFNDVWAFQEKITEEPDSVEHTATKVPYRPIGRLSGEITKQTLAEKTAILQLLNRAAAECTVGKDINGRE